MSKQKSNLTSKKNAHLVGNAAEVHILVLECHPVHV